MFMECSGLPADLSSNLENALYDDIVVPIAKKSFSRIRRVSETMLLVGKLVKGTSEETPKRVFDGYEVLSLVRMKWERIIPRMLGLYAHTCAGSRYLPLQDLRLGVAHSELREADISPEIYFLFLNRGTNLGGERRRQHDSL